SELAADFEVPLRGRRGLSLDRVLSEQREVEDVVEVLLVGHVGAAERRRPIPFGALPLEPRVEQLIGVAAGDTGNDAGADLALPVDVQAGGQLGSAAEREFVRSTGTPVEFRNEVR